MKSRVWTIRPLFTRNTRRPVISTVLPVARTSACAFHFPTKEALFEAILVDRMDRVAERAEGLAEAKDAGAAFVSVLEVLAAESSKKKDFVHALGAGFQASKELLATKKRFRAALDALLERAQRGKQIRGDVTTSDVLALLHGVLSVRDASADARKRHLAIVLDGLRRR